ncbi:hypothetical protein PV325_012980, partial [Microctonus aethiopoides]
MLSNLTCDKQSNDYSNITKESEGFTKQTNSSELANENDFQNQCCNNSLTIIGNGYSTPVDEASLELRDSMGISAIGDELSAKSSSAPSGFTEMDEFMDDSLVRMDKKAFIDIHLSKGPPIDGRKLRISPSKKNEVVTSKKHFCQFCQTTQTKYARHILKAHSDNVEVQKCLSFPVLSKEREREIAKLRKRGDFIHNTHANVNTG